MRRIDELHLEFPFAGSRMLQGLLKQEGFEVGRLHVATLMKRMGIEAIYRRPNTSKPAPGHKIYPYLLRGAGDRPAQPGLGHGHHLHPDGAGFVYLAAVVDWFTRRVLAWRLSITLEAAFCIEAWRRPCPHGRPEIFNTDQGSQFTGRLHKVLAEPGLRSAWTARAPGATTSSSSGSGGRSNTRRSTARLRQRARSPGLDRPLSPLLQRRRPHSSLDGQTPDQAYFNQLPTNPGGGITEAEIHLRNPATVQTNRATSKFLLAFIPRIC